MKKLAPIDISNGIEPVKITYLIIILKGSMYITEKQNYITGKPNYIQDAKIAAVDVTVCNIYPGMTLKDMNAHILAHIEDELIERGDIKVSKGNYYEWNIDIPSRFYKEMSFKFDQNTHTFQCRDAEKYENILKNYGFYWDENQEAWCKNYQNAAELSEIIADTFIKCNLPFGALLCLVFAEQECSFDWAGLSNLNEWNTEAVNRLIRAYNLNPEHINEVWHIARILGSLPQVGEVVYMSFKHKALHTLKKEYEASTHADFYCYDFYAHSGRGDALCAAIIKTKDKTGWITDIEIIPNEGIEKYASPEYREKFERKKEEISYIENHITNLAPIDISEGAESITSVYYVACFGSSLWVYDYPYVLPSEPIEEPYESGTRKISVIINKKIEDTYKTKCEVEEYIRKKIQEILIKRGDLKKVESTKTFTGKPCYEWNL